MGSRYGGLKQIDPIDEQGHKIIDYSVYDAKLAGFEKVIFIIKKEIEEAFHKEVGSRLEKHIDVEYAYQDLNNIPQAYTVPAEREKPWGTGHAVLSCKGMVDGPFAVINADDYYGRDAFKVMFEFLSTTEDDEKFRYTMVGYELHNTVTENGHVARGVCVTDEQGHLTDITERTRIEVLGNEIAFTEDDGQSWVKMENDTIVSMNMWGFTEGFMTELDNRMAAFMEAELISNPLKCEYFLPSVVSQLLEEDKATVKVLKSRDKWYGVTYKADKPVIVAATQEMKDAGMYPQILWGNH